MLRVWLQCAGSDTSASISLLQLALAPRGTPGELIYGTAVKIRTVAHDTARTIMVQGREWVLGSLVMKNERATVDVLDLATSA
jgi:hypothetical protein